MHIADILIRYILNSRGLPTIETELSICSSTNMTIIARAATALGVSCGGYEYALNPKQNVLTTIQHVKEAVLWANNKLTPSLKGLKINHIATLDQSLLQIPDFDKNFWRRVVLTSISTAAYKAYGLINKYDEFAIYIQDSLQNNISSFNDNKRNIKYKLPRPWFNLINGGMHAINGGSVQEFLVIPVSSKTFEESMIMGLVINESLYEILYAKDLILGVGDEGGWIIKYNNIKKILELLMQAIDRTRYLVGEDVILGLDMAASVLYDKNYYFINDKILRPEDMIIFYEKIIDHYPVGIIEDPLTYNDVVSWQSMYNTLGKRVLLVGDDLFASQVKYLSDPKACGMSNAALAKPNQAGTISQLTAFCDLAKQYHWPVILSHRSGETEDNYLANLAVDLCCSGIKAGGLMRSERLAKYNQLLRIEERIQFYDQHAGMHDIKYHSV